MKHDARQFCRRTRREFLWESGGGFGAVALTGLLSTDGFFNCAAAATPASFVNPLAPKKPHFTPKAKAVIFIFCYGGPSHVDTFDYKPKLYPLDGKTIPIKTFGRGGHKNEGRVVGPKWQFKQYGECGKSVSDLFPNIATCVDDIAFVHSFYAESPIPRLGHVDDELRPAAQRQPGPRLVGELRPRLGQRKLTRFCRHARQNRRAHLRPENLVQRLHAGGIPGNDFASDRHADLRPTPRRRGSRRKPNGCCSTACANGTRNTSRLAPTTANWPPASPVMS